MRRRRPGNDGQVMPEHLRRFCEADWLPLLTRDELDPPAGWEWPPPWWRDMHARARWREAGKAWLIDHGHDEREWWRATRAIPGVDYQPISR